MGSAWNLIPVAVRSNGTVTRVLTSKPGLWFRNLVRVRAKAIAALIAPLLAARVAGWLGYAVPLPLLVQALTALIVAASVYLPRNKPRLPVAAPPT